MPPPARFRPTRNRPRRATRRLVTNIVSLRDAIGETNTAAASVLSASDELTAMAETLSREVEKFFHNLRSGSAETRKSA